MTFIGHDARGPSWPAPCCGACAPPSGSPTTSPALTRHHLRLGFLVHERPLSRRAAWRYLRATEPYAADVTIFTVADRLATRGKNAEPAIAAHLELAREMLAHALAERAAGPRAPLIRGDELGARARAASRARGSASCSPQLEEARYAGEIATREDALRLARSSSRPPLSRTSASHSAAASRTVARCRLAGVSRWEW